MDSIDWMKKAINSIFDPEKLNQEKEKLFKEKVEPLLQEMLTLCKDNDLPIAIIIGLGKERVLAVGGTSKDPMQSAILNLFNLFEKALLENTQEKVFEKQFNITIDSIKKTLFHIIKLRKKE